MALKIAEFHECPYDKQDHQVIRIPFHFLGEHEQLNAVEEAEEYPVMCRIYENTLEWHGFSAEHMDELGL